MKQDLDWLQAERDEDQQECIKQKAFIDMCRVKFAPHPAPPTHATATSCDEVAGTGQPQAEGGQDVALACMQEADPVEATDTGAPPAPQSPIPLPQEEQEMEVDPEEVTEEEEWLLGEDEDEEAADQDADASGVSSPDVPPEEAEALPDAGGETPSAGMTAGMSGLSVTLSQVCKVGEPSEGLVETVTLPAEDSTASPEVE